MIGLSDSTDAGCDASLLEEVAGLVFGREGCLVRALGLEHRMHQEKMARETARAMAEDTPLLFEAGTGTGKSLAYLIPGLVRAQREKRPFLVSTKTISLQEQLRDKDIPLCREIFRKGGPQLEPYAEFRSALLLGKGNYLCPRRLRQALAGAGDLFDSSHLQELERIRDWAARTENGLMRELHPPPVPEVWEWCNADAGTCSARHCTADSCFYQKAKARIRQSHLLILNHSLFFALLGTGGFGGGTRGVLYPDDFVVLDEAHTVPEVATEYFGARISSFGLDRLLKGLYHEKRHSGLCKRLGRPALRQHIVDAQEICHHFFGTILERYLSKKAEVRIREPDWCEPVALPALRKVVKGVEELLDDLAEGPLYDEIRYQKERLQAAYRAMLDFVHLKAEDHVHWLERTGRSGQIVHLRSAPLDVAPYLRETLFSRMTSVLMTSATLSLNGSLEVFATRTGAEEARQDLVSSPFDYRRNMEICVAADIGPAPNRENGPDLEAVFEYLAFLVERVAGGTLVLFTNYRDLRLSGEYLQPVLARTGRPLLRQGQGMPNDAMIDRFREAGNAVLLGTDTFWTGIDVAGPALSQVIIVKLPFDVPSHPVAEARSEAIEERGGSPFLELALPDALVRFRQGVGRLIRTRTDRGRVAILDSRILRKPYGRQFLANLPHREVLVIHREDRDERVAYLD